MSALAISGAAALSWEGHKCGTSRKGLHKPGLPRGGLGSSEHPWAPDGIHADHEERVPAGAGPGPRRTSVARLHATPVARNECD